MFFLSYERFLSYEICISLLAFQVTLLFSFECARKSRTFTIHALLAKKRPTRQRRARVVYVGFFIRQHSSPSFQPCSSVDLDILGAIWPNLTSHRLENCWEGLLDIFCTCGIFIESNFFFHSYSNCYYAN